MNSASPTAPPPLPAPSAARRAMPRRRRWAVLLAAVLPAVCGTLPAAAAPPGPSVTAPAPEQAPVMPQSVLDRIVAGGVPGVIALRRRGSEVRTATSGTSDRRTGDPIHAGDRLRIGSNTKTFVATVVLQLAGERRLRLTDTVERWLPGLVPNGSAITIRQLLHHTSGLYDYAGDPRLLAPYATDRAHYWPPRGLVALAASHPPLFPPGASWSYSNTNYVLLGLVIEAVTGRRADAEVRERVLRPLGLHRTTFPLRNPRLPHPHTRGYLTNLPVDTAPDGVLDSTVLSPSIAWTSGGMVSTVGDLARFQRALLTGRLLRPAQMRELTTVVPGSDYGTGIIRWDTSCGTAWGHDGAFPGYLSIALTSGDGERQAVLALNTDRVLSEGTLADVDTAVETLYCGSAGPGGRQRPTHADGAGEPGERLRRFLPSAAPGTPVVAAARATPQAP
ncbi:beta-lactamase family protein [Streptomyces sp. ICN441]|uniref:serine hydrolase domain-containing protein n=1 Tax=Streptomyces sp. ICN441 TaxID=2558286 RepID=UPI001F0EED0D|nr:beta-lactamase family protein [Streptomyces sp. ICN441]